MGGRLLGGSGRAVAASLVVGTEVADDAGFEFTTGPDDVGALADNGAAGGATVPSFNIPCCC